MPSRVRTTLNLALGATAVALVGLLGLAFVPTLLGHEVLVVVNGSMAPALPVGSVAITEMVDVASIVKGDVVTFRYPGQEIPVTHRVIRVSEHEGQRVFRTQGDANATADAEPLRLGSGSIARVERVVPYAGSVARFARSFWGLVLLLGLPLAGVVFGGGSNASRRQRQVLPNSSSRPSHVGA